jgi:hypothetical protein
MWIGLGAGVAVLAAVGIVGIGGLGPFARSRPDRRPARAAVSRSDTAGADTAAGDTAAPAVLAGPVTIRGRVVDEASGAGIERAIVIVLEPGITSQAWMEARGEEASAALMQGTSVTDGEGAYEIADLARGGTYTVMVTAEGYDPAVFEGGLEVTTSDPPITIVGDVELAPR